jgi:hypothetical protein
MLVRRGHPAQTGTKGLFPDMRMIFSDFFYEIEEIKVSAA